MAEMTDKIAIKQDVVTKAIKTRHYIHAHPELSGQEFETTKLITKKLLELGITPLDLPLVTGVVADIGDSNKGPTIALRADMDALPIVEATDLPYASETLGVMHACGHDFHTSSLLAAAEVLKKHEDNLKGRIRFVFQPAEETNHGARELIKAGTLKDVAAIIGFHNKPDLPVGTIGFKNEALMAAVDQFAVRIIGTGTHAAAPQNGKDPIVTASQIVANAQAIISRYIAPTDSAVLSVTHIQGGNTWNVIPSDVFFEGTIRTFDETVRQKVKQLFADTISHTTALYGQSFEIEWIPGTPALYNDTDLGVIVKDVVSDFAKYQETGLTLGGEDFANYVHLIPGFFVFIGTGTPFEWHNPEFTVNDAAFPYAIAYYVNTSLRLLRHFN